MRRLFTGGSVAVLAFLAIAVPLQLAAQTKDPPKVNWQLAGSYFENCNCNVTCPCVLSANGPMTSAPSQGSCGVVFLFHIDRGKYGNVTLDGLNAVVMTDFPGPGPMSNGNWSEAAYIDVKGSEQQRAALQAIFTGAAGGPMDFGPLVTKMLGVKTVPITFTSATMKRSAEIPGVLHLGVHAVPGLDPGKEMWTTNLNPFVPENTVLAVGDEGNSFTDYDRNWENAGHNGFYAPIKWSSK